jgi:hypothetical protein
MSPDGAQRAVSVAAVIVGMVYAYRRLVEGAGATGPHVASKGAAKQLLGQGPPPPLSQWIVAYGFAFLVISVMAQAAPRVGGTFALLLALGTVLTQGQQLAADVNGQLGGAGAGGVKITPAAAVPISQLTPTGTTPDHPGVLRVAPHPIGKFNPVG